MQSLNDMNPRQQEAVRYLDGPLLVLAGAGSGKTRVITRKIAYLIESCDLRASHIAAITFTNKAAREMQERVAGLIEPAKTRGLTVATFHSLGMQILRQEAVHVGLKPAFSILDAADQQHVVSEILKTTDAAEIRRLHAAISRWKNAMISPGGALSAVETEADLAAARVYRQYQDTLKAYQAVDFDDLIRLPVELFDAEPEVLQRWSNKLRYLLVDEYQDTNDGQYRLVRQLAGVRGAFTAVGDDDQAIYAWRGANSENIAHLQRDYPTLNVIKLEQNYRSSQNILKAANLLIAHNPKLFDKQLWSDRGVGDALTVTACQHEEHEAESVVMRLSAHRFAQRTRYADYAILYRSNHQARLLEQYLRNEKIPYQISGGSSFFDKSEIRTLVAYLRLLVNPEDEPAFIRAATTPRRGIGNQTLETLGDWAAERQQSLFAAAFEAGLAARLQPRQHEALMAFCAFVNRMQARAEREPAGQIMTDLLAAIDYETWLYDNFEPRVAKGKWANVQELVEWIARKAEQDKTTVIELVQSISLINILDNREDEEVDAVRLSTLHAAKGLEWPHVYLIGVEEGILPHRESVDNGQIEEERRLMYVGITRAQRSLHISWCMKRRRGQEMAGCDISRFIEEMAGAEIVHSGRPVSIAQQKQTGAEWLAKMKAMVDKPGDS